MRYAQVADLLQRESAQNVAEAAAPDNAAVGGDLLTAMVAGGATGRWDEATIEDGKAAIERVQQHLDDATAGINGYIQARYPQLVQQPEPRNADLLKRLCLDIAGWDLLGGDADSDRRHKHKSAMTTLRDIASGVVALLTSAASDNDVAAGARFSGHAPLFGRDDLMES